MGWRDRQKSLLLPVTGEIFLLTLPFIERRYRTSGVLVRHMSGNATNQGENRAHQISIAFVVVSPDVERANPVRGTWNTILDAVHGFSLARDCQSIFNFGLSERLWRVARHTSLACLGHHFAIGYPAVQVAGLWLLIGAPLTLWLPYAVCRMAHACSQNRLACP
jgi:hypothetical protein